MAKKKSVKRASKKTKVGLDGPSREAALLASPVADIARFITVFMDDSHAKRSVEIETDPKNITVNINRAESGIDINRSSKIIAIKIRFVVTAARKNARKSDDPLVDIMARYVILYELSSLDGIEEPNLKAFAQNSGIFSVWPYLREFVHSMSLRLSVPPIILPTYRIWG